jgi:hypothetical protein
LRTTTTPASPGNDFTNPGLQVFLATLDPNTEINSLRDYREWTGRFDGAYIFPWDIQVSANFEQPSGAPYARTVSFRGPQPIPSFVMGVEPFGTRRLPSVNFLHVRVEKSLRFARRRLSLRMSVFNMTNINTEQSITQLSARTSTGRAVSSRPG